MNVDTMSIAQVNNALVSRHSRTSGTEEARRQRLKRFLEFEKQKERRSQYVQQMRQEKADREEMDGQQDDVCYDGCPCNYEEDKEKAADALLALRTQDTLQTLREHIAELDECYEVVVAENLRLNHRINNLEMRLSHVENRSDSPPPLIFTESNPNWVLDTAFTT